MKGSQNDMKLQSIVTRITKHELNSILMQVLVTQVLVRT